MRSILLMMSAAGVLLLTASASLKAEEGQRKYGVIHNIAEDRMVERVGGVYEPEGIDKYMKRRFDDMKDQINRMDSRLENMEGQLAEALDRLDDLAVQEEVSDAETSVSSAARPLNASPAPIRSSGTSILIGSSGRTEIRET